MDPAPDAAAALPELVHASANLRVLRTVGDPSRIGGGCDFVSFEPIGRRNPRWRPHGQAFACKYGLNALHVIPSGWDWYEYPDMPDCLQEVRRHLGPAATLTGGSMGGYAALRFADALGAAKVLAFAPQLSIRRAIVPTERRWQYFAERIAFGPDDGRVPERARLYIAYDPHTLDAPHAELIAAQAGERACLLPVHRGGHVVGRRLADIGLLSTIAISIISGWPSAAALNAMIAERNQPPPDAGAPTPAAPRPPGAEDYAREARGARGPHLEKVLRAGLALAPGHGSLNAQLAIYLQRRNRHEEAAACLRAALAAGDLPPRDRVWLQRVFGPHQVTIPGGPDGPAPSNTTIARPGDGPS